MKTLKVLGFLGLALVAPIGAWAGCVTADLAGSWRVYEVFLTHGGYQHCGLWVDAQGWVRPGTWCRDSSGVDSYTTGGRFVVKPNCRIEGEASNWFGTLRIDNAFLDPSYETVTGVGTVNGGLVYVSAVRRTVP